MISFINILLNYDYKVLSIRYRPTNVIEISLGNIYEELYWVFYWLLTKEIAIRCSPNALESFSKFEIESICDCDSKKRKIKKRKIYSFLCFQKCFSITETSDLKNGLKRILNYLNKKIEKSDSISCFINDLLAINEENSNFSIFTTDHDILSCEIGYSTTILTQEPSNRKQYFIENKENKNYIKSFIWISPFAKSIIMNKNVSCIQLDTTFKSVKPYSMCIPMAIIHNVGVPLGCVIGSTENTDLYESFYRQVEINLNIEELSSIPVLSDLGVAIKSFCEKRKITQYYCHRHLIERLGARSPMIPIINSLIKCDCEESLNINLISCSTLILKLIEIRYSRKNIEEGLNRIGFSFIDGSIVLYNSDLFNSMSLIQRKKFGIPTTTNHVEASHGHLNSITPRRNCIFSVVNRVASFIIRKTNNFLKCHHKNVKKKLMEMQFQISKNPSSILNQEVELFKTTQDICLCGKSNINGKLFGIPIPCIHQAYIGVEIPQMNNLIYENPIFEEENNYGSEIIEESDPCIFSHMKKQNWKISKKSHVSSNKTFSMKLCENITNSLSCLMDVSDKDYIMRIVISCFADTIPLNPNSISYDCFTDIYFKAVFILFENKKLN